MSAKRATCSRSRASGKCPAIPACANSSTRSIRSLCDRCSNRSLGLCNAVKPWKRWSLSTGHSSQEVHCESCLERHHRRTPSWAIARAEVRLDRDPNLLDAKGGPSLMARGASKPTTGASNCPWRPRRHRSYRIFKAERELLLNRKNMDDMMTEIGFGGSGAVQVGTAARFGRMVGAAGGHGSDYGF